MLIKGSEYYDNIKLWHIAKFYIISHLSYICAIAYIFIFSACKYCLKYYGFGLK